MLVKKNELCGDGLSEWRSCHRCDKDAYPEVLSYYSRSEGDSAVSGVVPQREVHTGHIQHSGNSTNVDEELGDDQ